MNVNTQIYDKSVDRAAMIRLYERRSIGKVELIIDGHAIRVDQLIKKSKLQGKSFSQFQHDLDDEIIKTMADTHNVSSKSLKDLFKSQVDFSVNNLSTAIGKVWKVEQPSRVVAANIVLSQPLYQNKTLDQGWAGIGKNEKIRIEEIIRKGIAEGLSNSDIADEVRKSTYLITKNQARGLVITATTSVYAQADHQVYSANEKALQGWQYVAVLDSRTTPLCAHRDGHIYPISDTEHLPPAHWYCRSSTIPVVKDYESLGSLEGVAQIRKRNLTGLSDKQIALYDGQTPLKESYSEWLRRQPTEVQIRHLGDTTRLELFRSGQLPLDKFTNAEGNSIGIRELRQLTDNGLGVPGDSRRFAFAKEKLDTIKIGAARPDEIIESTDLRKALKEYYLLQAGELDGTLSLTNYRGTLLHNKKNTKTRVLTQPPREEHLKYNPITGRYDDARIYQPSPDTLTNVYKLVDESDKLLPVDKKFIKEFVDGLEDSMGINERAVITENLRIVFGRFRENGESWSNLKAVLQGQIKFDIMNVSDYMETQIRKDANLLFKLKQDNYIDPVLGPVQLQSLHDNFVPTIVNRNKWEDSTLITIARELRNVIDLRVVPVKLKIRLSDEEIEQFYLKFAKRLSLADSPDRDQLAIALGRDLYNGANFRGTRNEWFTLGKTLLDEADSKGFYELETFGVQKRRMKSRNFGAYFGPYYDTFSVNLRIVDPRIQAYSKMNRQIDVGLRVGVTDGKNRLIVREGYKTYFVDRGLYGMYDTRIPIISSSSFSEFPARLIDRDMTTALNWAADAKYKVDEDFHDFIVKLLNFQDDKGKAQYYTDLNHYREYILERGDSYERFKAMAWLRSKNASFSNHPFLDHRARIYERGFIGPQSGETFRPFLNTADAKRFSKLEFLNFQDQIGSFLGGASDTLEGRYNSLSVLGRQQIAIAHRKELIEIGDLMRRGKPNDIRKILESPFLAEIDGEEQGKVLRFALEMSKINEFLGGDFSAGSLAKLSNYRISIALEQDASSSGAQIIALTTKNKQLAELSNVVPTNQKQRLYDEIAERTFNDPRFRKLNEKLGLTEKDLRKASKAQNMVTLYGAGERTGIMNVETKLAKILDKQDDFLVVKATERDKVLAEISARMARYESWDPDTYRELKALRQDVKEMFNKGLHPGDEMMEQLYFLDPQTRDFVEKLGRSYNNIVTPDDFQQIALIMSENLRSEVPILKDFTKFFGRLAADFAEHAKPADSAFSVTSALKTAIFGEYKAGRRLPRWLSKTMAIRDESIKEKMLRRIPGYVPDKFLSNVVSGARAPTDRLTGKTIGKVSHNLGFKIGKHELWGDDLIKGWEVGYPNKLEKRWTAIPWVNFDGRVLEQNFTQTFEEKLAYKDASGKWINNIVQIQQKTDPSVWDQIRNKDGKINDIADLGKARTAFAVNGNHSNDATLVKQFHLWGAKNNVQTGTVHDAFFTNAADMLASRQALREIYATAVKSESVKATLDEMLARGLPRALYNQYMDEAIAIGIIPVAGKSRVGGKLLTKADILTYEDILQTVPSEFKDNRYWYGVG
jgi:SPP1 gp7 family putative phage head morphogenesis protein